MFHKTRGMKKIVLQEASNVKKSRFKKRRIKIKKGCIKFQEELY